VQNGIILWADKIKQRDWIYEKIGLFGISGSVVYSGNQQPFIRHSQYRGKQDSYITAKMDILKTLFEVFLCDYQEIFSFQIRVPGAEC
jgi:hypothetical protein